MAWGSITKDPHQRMPSVLPSTWASSKIGTTNCLSTEAIISDGAISKESQMRNRNLFIFWAILYSVIMFGTPAYFKWASTPQEVKCAK